MKTITFTEILEELKECQLNVFSDINSDWIDEDNKRKMTTQLMLLNQSISNLELIMKDKDGQIFQSAIKRK